MAQALTAIQLQEFNNGPRTDLTGVHAEILANHPESTDPPANDPASRVPSAADSCPNPSPTNQHPARSQLRSQR